MDPFTLVLAWLLSAIAGYVCYQFWVFNESLATPEITLRGGTGEDPVEFLTRYNYKEQFMTVDVIRKLLEPKNYLEVLRSGERRDTSLERLTELYSGIADRRAKYSVTDMEGRKVKAIDVIEKWTNDQKTLKALKTDENGIPDFTQSGEDYVYFRRKDNTEQPTTIDEAQKMVAFAKFLTEKFSVTTDSGTRSMTLDDLAKELDEKIEVFNAETDQWELVTPEYVEMLTAPPPMITDGNEWFTPTVEILDRVVEEANEKDGNHVLIKFILESFGVTASEVPEQAVEGPIIKTESMAVMFRVIGPEDVAETPPAASSENVANAPAMAPAEEDAGAPATAPAEKDAGAPATAPAERDAGAPPTASAEKDAAAPATAPAEKDAGAPAAAPAEKDAGAPPTTSPAESAAAPAEPSVENTLNAPTMALLDSAAGSQQSPTAEAPKTTKAAAATPVPKAAKAPPATRAAKPTKASPAAPDKAKKSRKKRITGKKAKIPVPLTADSTNDSIDDPTDDSDDLSEEEESSEESNDEPSDDSTDGYGNPVAVQKFRRTATPPKARRTQKQG